MKTSRWLVPLVVLLSPWEGAAQERTRTIPASAQVELTRTMSPAEAERQAMMTAWADAVRKVAGLRVQATQTLVKSENASGVTDLFSEMTNVSGSGRVTGERVIASALAQAAAPDGRTMTVWNYEAELTIALEDEERDEGFRIEAELSRESYKDGEPLSVTIRSSRDCHLYLFNILSTDTVQILLPNAITTDNTIAANKATVFPSRNAGYTLPVALGDASLSSRVDHLMVVAVKENIPLPMGKSVMFNGLRIFPSQKSALLELNRWIASIPLAQRADAYLSYEIRRK